MNHGASRQDQPTASCVERSSWRKAADRTNSNRNRLTPNVTLVGRYTSATGFRFPVGGPPSFYNRLLRRRLAARAQVDYKPMVSADQYERLNLNKEPGVRRKRAAKNNRFL